MEEKEHPALIEFNKSYAKALKKLNDKGFGVAYTVQPTIIPQVSHKDKDGNTKK